MECDLHLIKLLISSKAHIKVISNFISKNVIIIVITIYLKSASMLVALLLLTALLDGAHYLYGMTCGLFVPSYLSS
jgi:hypothetical protein